MPNYEIDIQVNIRATDQDVTPEATPSNDGGFRIVINRESGQSIDQCEQALLAVNYPAIREVLSRHLSEVSRQEANELLSHRLIFFVDGNYLYRKVLELFSWHKGLSVILDWYHLKKKCKSLLSMAMKGTEIRKKI